MHEANVFRRLVANATMVKALENTIEFKGKTDPSMKTSQSATLESPAMGSKGVLKLRPPRRCLGEVWFPPLMSLTLAKLPKVPRGSFPKTFLT